MSICFHRKGSVEKRFTFHEAWIALAGGTSGSLLGIVLAVSSLAPLAHAAEEGAVSPKILKGAKQMAAKAKANAVASAEYHFSLAQAYSSDGDLDRSIEEYKLALLFDSNSPLLYTRLAAEYVRKGLLAAAMESCKDALKLNPKFQDAHLILGGLYAASHDISSAIKEYDGVLKVSPQHEEAVVYKAQLLIENAQALRAIQDLKQFIKKNPESSLAWYFLGRAEHQRENTKNAIIAYRKAMSLRPGFSQAGIALGFLYEEKQSHAKAVEVYKTLFEESQDPAAANRLSLLYLKEGHYEQAIPLLQFLEEADPEDMNVKVKLGLVQMEMKHFDQAIVIFKKILQKNPDSDRIHYYLGSLYEEIHKPELAVVEFKSIEPRSRLFQDGVLHAGFLLKQLGKLDEARKWVQDATEKTPKNPALYIFEANLEEESKNLLNAEEILEKASRDFPNDERILYYLGAIYDHQGKTDKSLHQMEMILGINPKNVDALNYLGYTWTQKGIRLSDAERVLKKALVLSPNNGYIQDSWGWYLFTLGKIKQAVIELEKAAKMKPHESTILEHLGDAYVRSNLRAKALNQYRDALRFADTEDLRKKVENKVAALREELDSPHNDRRLPAAESE